MTDVDLETVYEVVLKEITFVNKDLTSEDWIGFLDDVWQYAFYLGDNAPDELEELWKNLTAAGDMLIPTAADGDKVVLLLRVKADANPDYLNGTLQFSVEIR